MRIADDFTPPKDTAEHDDTARPLPAPIDEGEARLALSPSPAPAASISEASPGLLPELRELRTAPGQGGSKPEAIEPQRSPLRYLHSKEGV